MGADGQNTVIAVFETNDADKFMRALTIRNGVTENDGITGGVEPFDETFSP